MHEDRFVLWPRSWVPGTMAAALSWQSPSIFSTWRGPSGWTISCDKHQPSSTGIFLGMQLHIPNIMFDHFLIPIISGFRVKVFSDFWYVGIFFFLLSIEHSQLYLKDQFLLSANRVEFCWISCDCRFILQFIVMRVKMDWMTVILYCPSLGIP